MKSEKITKKNTASPKSVNPPNPLLQGGCTLSKLFRNTATLQHSITASQSQTLISSPLLVASCAKCFLWVSANFFVLWC